MELGHTLQQVGLMLLQPLVTLFGITGEQQGFTLFVANISLTDQRSNQGCIRLRISVAGMEN